MKITVLGSGSGLDASLGNTSLLLSNENHKMLIDCGYTVVPKLLELGLQDDIKSIFISHLHSDHAGSLCALLEYNCFVKGKKTQLCGIDLKGYIDIINPTLWDLCVNEEKVQEVQLIKTEHVPNADSFGALFFDKVFYSGDTGYPLLDSDLAKCADVIIHEAYPEDMLLGGGDGEYIHVGIDTLANSADAETRAKTWITHYSKKDADHLRKKCHDLGFAGLLEPGQEINI